MIKKIIFIFICLFVGLTLGKALTYTSLPTTSCNVNHVCDFKVKDESNNQKVVFCLNDTLPYASNKEYIDNDYNPDSIINGFKVSDYECGLKNAYYEIPELKNDLLYDSNGYLDFSKLDLDTFIWVQANVWNVRCPDEENEGNSIDGSINVKFGEPTFDVDRQEYTVNYVISSNNIKSGTLSVSSNAGTLSSSSGSGKLTIKASELSSVQYNVKITASAQVAKEIKPKIDTSFKVLTPVTNGSQELGIPTLHREMVTTYESSSKSDSLEFKYGSIIITKVSEKNASIKLKNVEFKIEHCVNDDAICSVEPAYDIDGKLINTKLTSETGIASFEKLPYGMYKITEVKSASGYQIGNNSYIIKTLNEENNNIKFTFKNVPKNIKISKKEISGENEIEGAKICIYLYDLTNNKKKSEKAYECFESGSVPYEFYAEPGDYILEETVEPKGYERLNTGFIFSVSNDFKIELKDVQTKFIKLNTEKDMITIYNTPVKVEPPTKESPTEESPTEEVSVDSTGRNAKLVYTFISLVLIVVGSGLISFRYLKRKKS